MPVKRARTAPILSRNLQVHRDMSIESTFGIRIIKLQAGIHLSSNRVKEKEGEVRNLRLLVFDVDIEAKYECRGIVRYAQRNHVFLQQEAYDRNCFLNKEDGRGAFMKSRNLWPRPEPLLGDRSELTAELVFVVAVATDSDVADVVNVVPVDVEDTSRVIVEMV